MALHVATGAATPPLAAKSAVPSKGVKAARGGGKSVRKRTVEANCPAELVDHLHDADMQGLVVECAVAQFRCSSPLAYMVR